ncbi:MAG: hypothetical protein ACLQJR_08110 [Stellaceae bacterium]
MGNNGMFAPLPGSGRPPRRAAPGGEWVVIVPVPSAAPPAPDRHPTLGPAALRHLYRAAGGELAGYVLRFNQPDGGKEFRALTWCRNTETEATQWRWKSWAVPRPLYGLDRLSARPNAPVVVCEGEKSADAAGRLLPEHVSVTAPNGSKSAGQADWSVLRQRQVVIWPDADDAGASYAAAVAHCLAAIGALARIITPPAGVAIGWDAADAEAEGWTSARAVALVQSAAVFAAERTRPDGSGARNTDQEGASAPRGRREGPPQRDLIIDQLGDAELWHDESREAFATVPLNGHHENLALRSRDFRLWLTGRYYKALGSSPGAQAYEDALRVIEAAAVNDGTTYRTWRRVGEAGGGVYIDLGTSDWRSVEITSQRWRVVDRASCRFIRSPAMRALPVPEAGDTIETLREFVNVGDGAEGDAAFMLVVAWLVAALRPRGPFPILAVNGEQGAAKSTLSRLLRDLVDPNASLLRAAPRDERDLLVAAHNSWVIALDNLSSLPIWLADGLCRLSTGGGFSTRELHTDRGEVIFEATRPILLNGIGDVAGRPDLASRALVITLPAIPESRRRIEAQFLRAFQEKAPGIFGALLDAVSGAQRHLAETKLDRLPRMADFAQWTQAASASLGWERGAFLAAYEANQAGATEVALEASAIAVVLRKFVLSRFDAAKGWEGTATELLAQLDAEASDALRVSRHWPKTASELGSQLRRIAPVLRAHGVEIEQRRDGKDRQRVVHVYLAR